MACICIQYVSWVILVMPWRGTVQERVAPGTSPALVTTTCLWRRSWPSSTRRMQLSSSPPASWQMTLPSSLWLRCFQVNTDLWPLTSEPQAVSVSHISRCSVILPHCRKGVSISGRTLFRGFHAAFTVLYRVRDLLRCREPRINDSGHQEQRSQALHLPPQWQPTPWGAAATLRPQDTQDSGVWDCALHGWWVLNVH